MVSYLTPQSAPRFTTLDSTAHVGGGHLLARWEHDFSVSNNIIFQGYIDHTQRQDIPASGFLNTYDIDCYQRLEAGYRHFLMWGVGYRCQLINPLQMDAIFRYVDNLLALGVQYYINMDISLHWRLSQKWRLSIVGQNLLHKYQVEWKPTYSQVIPGQPERGVYVSFRCLF